MFESKIAHAQGVAPHDVSVAGHEGLRSVRWPDLVARFDAARELRAGLGAGEAHGEASFDPDSARHIAELAEGKRDINLDDLANGKAAGRISRSDKNGAASDDPRT